MKRTWPYDMWSLGVVWLEMLLATPHVFQISPRTAAVLQRRLQHNSQVDRSFSVPDLELCCNALQAHARQAMMNCWNHVTLSRIGLWLVIWQCCKFL